jgi:hypothetical protein
VKKIPAPLVFGVDAGAVSWPFFDAARAELLGIVAFLVAMRTWNALPPGIVSLLPIFHLDIRARISRVSRIT